MLSSNRKEVAQLALFVACWPHSVLEVLYYMHALYGGVRGERGVQPQRQMSGTVQASNILYDMHETPAPNNGLTRALTGS